VTITIVVMTNPPAGDIGNTASVAGNQPDPNTANNSATETTNVGDVSRLINISTRGLVGTGANQMIGGFVIGGDVPKFVFLRAYGPSLADFGLTGVLPNPFLEVRDSLGNLVASQDNWQDTPFCAPGYQCLPPPAGFDPCTPFPGFTSPPPDCQLEPAFQFNGPPEAYTALQSGVGTPTGLGLIGVTDLDPSTLPKMVNISTRGFVSTGADVMIGGFVIGAGSGSETVVIRGYGPTLAGAPFNLTGVLANPFLQIYSQQTNPATLIAENDTWQTPIGSQALCQPVPAADPFNPCQPFPGQTSPPPGCQLEPALTCTLSPGAYTAILSGGGGGTGIGLVGITENSP
jgi:hypothetical protein